MRYLTLAVALTAVFNAVCSAATPDFAFEKLHLTDKFLCEGAYYADFDRDGKMDVVAGPYWYAGPDFQRRHEIRPVQEFDLSIMAAPAEYYLGMSMRQAGTSFLQ